MTHLRATPKLSPFIALCAGLMACAPPGHATDAELGQGVSAQEQTDVTRDDDTRLPPKACGGVDALTCDDGQFCNTERAVGGESCELPQAKGVCEPIAEVCTLEYEPVCGCNHRTYPTACRAHFYGVSVLHDGACTHDDCAAAGGTVSQGQSVHAEVTCPVDREERGIVQTASGEAAGVDAVCCVPRAAPVCRVVDRTSVSHDAVAQALVTSTPELSLYQTVAHRVGDAFAILPSPSTASSFLRVTRAGAVDGVDLSRVGANIFAVAGATPAEELVGLRLGGLGATAAALDLTTLQWREPHPFSLDLRFHGQTRQVAAAPALDGRRSVFAMGNRVVGPVDVGMIGPGGAPLGPVARACDSNQDCTCLSVLPTQDAGIVSMLQLPRTTEDRGPQWRTITFDASGKVVRDASLPVPTPDYGCPLVVGSDAGPVGLFGKSSALSLLRFDDPARPVRLVTSPGHPALGLSVSGDDAVVLEYGQPPSVAHARGGVVDPASRLVLADAEFDVQVIASRGSDLMLYYRTEHTREIVAVACR